MSPPRQRLATRSAWGLVVVGLLGLGACGGDSSDADRRGADDGAPPRIVADTSTRAAAQKLVDQAADRLAAEGTGHYELTWGAGRLETREMGDYSIRDFATRTVTSAPTEDTNFTTEIVHIGADAFGRSYLSGRPEGCWGHVSRGEGAEARTLAYPLAITMVFQPKVRGLMRGGDGSDIVVDVALKDGAWAALRSLARENDAKIPETAIVPARVRIVDGAYQSMSFRMVDILDGLQDAGLDVKAGSDIPPRTFGSLPEQMVRIEYSRGGADVDIARPPPENTTEMDGVPLGEEPEPCKRLPRH